MLDRGGVLILPTDTVYGLAARADRPQAVRDIYRLKGRSFRKPLVLFVSGLTQAESLVLDPPPAFFDLAQRFWPGPLTLVLPASETVKGWGLDSEGTIGLRCCREPVVQLILERAGVPLATTSANRSGQPECYTALEALQSLRREPDLVWDGGERPRRPPSTVLDLSRRLPLILRKGSVGPQDLESAGVKAWLLKVNVLFVCTGNTCRSPMAAGLLQHRLPSSLRVRVKIASSGTGALADMPATEFARQAARRAGFDISAHRSQPLSLPLLEWADLIVAMEPRHLSQIASLSPQARTRLMAPEGVPDPIGGTLADYQKALKLMEENLPGLIQEIEALLAH